VRAETKRMPPPLLYDLTELHATATALRLQRPKTLGRRSALYESKKLISYPRTAAPSVVRHRHDAAGNQ